MVLSLVSKKVKMGIMTTVNSMVQGAGIRSSEALALSVRSGAKIRDP